MKRLLWPGVPIALLGSLVLLHAATLVLALPGPEERAVPAAFGEAARPRAGWLVEIEGAVEPDGLLRLVVRIGDATARPIADARVTLRSADYEVALLNRGQGRYEGMLAAAGAAAIPCRVEVSRGGHRWTFDRTVQPGAAEPGA